MYRISSRLFNTTWLFTTQPSFSRPSKRLRKKEKKKEGNQLKKNFLYKINFPLKKLGKKKKRGKLVRATRRQRPLIWEPVHLIYEWPWLAPTLRTACRRGTPPETAALRRRGGRGGERRWLRGPRGPRKREGWLRGLVTTFWRRGTCSSPVSQWSPRRSRKPRWPRWLDQSHWIPQYSLRRVTGHVRREGCKFCREWLGAW